VFEIPSPESKIVEGATALPAPPPPARMYYCIIRF